MSGFDAWITIRVGTVEIETGLNAPHYAPDVVRDMWSQAITGLKETVEAAIALGAVHIIGDDDEVIGVIDDEDDTE